MYAKGTTWTVARQIAFFAPVDMKGKWHAAHKVTHTPACGRTMALGREAIRTAQGQDSAKVHPLVCRRCLYLATAPGYAATGYES